MYKCEILSKTKAKRAKSLKFVQFNFIVLLKAQYAWLRVMGELGIKKVSGTYLNLSLPFRLRTLGDHLEIFIIFQLQFVLRPLPFSHSFDASKLNLVNN